MHCMPTYFAPQERSSPKERIGGKQILILRVEAF